MSTTSKKPTSPTPSLESVPAYANAAERYRQRVEEVVNLRNERAGLEQKLAAARDHTGDVVEKAARALLSGVTEPATEHEQARCRVAEILGRLPIAERALAIASADLARERRIASDAIVASVLPRYRALAVRLGTALLSIEEHLQAAVDVRAELEGAGIDANSLPMGLGIGLRVGHEGFVDRWVKRVVEADVLTLEDLPAAAAVYAPVPLRRAS